MTPQCDDCGYPATYHAGWQTATMPAPAFAYACDIHRREGMVPIDEPIISVLDALPDRKIVTAAIAWQLAQAQEMVDARNEGRKTPVDTDGEVIPSEHAFAKIKREYTIEYPAVRH